MQKEVPSKFEDELKFIRNHLQELFKPHNYEGGLAKFRRDQREELRKSTEDLKSEADSLNETLRKF